MKIALVTHRYPPDLGGIERHAQELARWLFDAGHEVVVHATNWDASYDSVETDGAITVYRHPSIAPNEAYYFSPGIAGAIYRTDADVVHAHSYHSLPALFAALGARSTPFVVTPHYTGHGSTSTRDWLHRLYAPLGGRALRSADAVIAVSEWERRQLSADFDCESTVIPNGVDVERFASATPYDHRRPYLFSVGRLVEYKGVQHAVRALAELPGYDLLIAGTGEYESELRGLAKRIGVEDRVTFLGYVPEADLPALYAGAAAHVFLSTYECFGITVAESLAAGTPCVVREATALSEWAAYDGCVSVSDVDPTAVAGGVEAAVAKTPKPDRLTTWADMSAAVLDVYQRVV